MCGAKFPRFPAGRRLPSFLWSRIFFLAEQLSAGRKCRTHDPLVRDPSASWDSRGCQRLKFHFFFKKVTVCRNTEETETHNNDAAIEKWTSFQALAVA